MQGATLIPRLIVDRSGTIIDAPDTATAAHDVTGGIATKISEAGAVCAVTDVFIAAAGTSYATAAVVGAVDPHKLMSSAAMGAERDEEWLGTYVRARR